MKRLIVILLTMSSIMAFAQQLDGYNCIYLNSHTNNQWGLDDRIKASFEKKGLKSLLLVQIFLMPQMKGWQHWS